MKKTVALLLGMGFAVLLWVLESQRGVAAQNENPNESVVDRESSVDRAIDNHAHHFLAQGKQIFRFDTFGDEAKARPRQLDDTFLALKGLVFP